LSKWARHEAVAERANAAAPAALGEDAMVLLQLLGGVDVGGRVNPARPADPLRRRREGVHLFQRRDLVVR